MKTLTALAGVLVAAALLAAPASPQIAPEADLKQSVAFQAAPPVPKNIPIALLIDQSSGQTLFARDAGRRFVPASVTKVMTAYTAFDLVEQGRLPLDRLVTIDEELEKEWSGEGSTMFLQAGEQPTVSELLLGVTTVSANDAAMALAIASVGSEAAWLALMNDHATQLGMRDTHYGTPNGWPDEGKTFTTARDLAILAEALTTRFPRLYARFFGKDGMSWNGIAQSNHDPISGQIDGADGIKTGFTRQSGFNFLGSASRDGRRLTMVIAAAPDAHSRDDTSRKLIEWGYSSFEPRRIFPGATHIGEAEIQDGAANSVGLMTPGDVIASIPKGQRADVSLSYRYRGPIIAPVGKGQGIGTLRIAISGQEPFETQLVASATVPRANMFQRLRNGLSRMFL